MTHVLIVGGGGREHALAWKLAQSPRLSRISVTPGNAGTAQIAHNVDIDATDVVSLLDFAETEGVDLTVVGPEDPLAGGLVDQFEAVGQRIFGPRRQAIMVEISKHYGKQLMQRQGIPTAPYELFTDLDGALDYVLTHPFEDFVIKADGLTRGRGIFVPRGESDAEGILRALLHRDALGRAGRRVIIEQRLVGDELLVMAFCDGKTVALMPPVRDYRRLRQGDTGPITGGMGASTPVPAVTPALLDTIRRTIIEPALAGLQAENCCFTGVLFAEIVLTADGPMALDLNARWSDPGAQVTLPLLDGDLLDVIEACLEGELAGLDVRWRADAAVSVTLATAGYPAHANPGLPVTLPSSLPDGARLFHAGTRSTPDGTLVTTGGRVFDVIGTGPDLGAAAARAYEAVRYIHFEGMYYRADIAAPARRNQDGTA